MAKTPDNSVERVFELASGDGLRMVSQTLEGTVALSRTRLEDGSDVIVIDYPGRPPGSKMQLSIRCRSFEQGIAIEEALLKYDLAGGGVRPATEQDLDYALDRIEDRLAEDSFEVTDSGIPVDALAA